MKSTKAANWLPLLQKIERLAKARGWKPTKLSLMAALLALGCAPDPNVTVQAAEQPAPIVNVAPAPAPVIVGPSHRCTLLVLEVRLASNHKRATFHRLFKNDELEAFLVTLDQGKPTGLPAIKEVYSVDALDVGCQGEGSSNE